MVLSKAARELAALLENYGVPSTARSAELMARYVDRARRFRFEWTFLATVVSVTVSIAWYRRLEIGVSTYPPLTDVPLVVMVGWFCGVIRTEFFRLRRAVPGRTAALVPRDPATFGSGGLFVASRLVVLLAAAAAASNELLPGSPVHPSTVDAIACLSVAVLAAAEICRRAIVFRPRPALPDDLAVADSAIRRIGLRGLGLGATGVALCCLGYMLSLMGLRPGGNQMLRLYLDIAGPVLLFLAVVLANAARTLVHVPVRRRPRPVPSAGPVGGPSPR